MDCPCTDKREEVVATAASLIVLKQLHPEYFQVNDEYVRNEVSEEYRGGAALAEELKYDMNNLKAEIGSFFREKRES